MELEHRFLNKNTFFYPIIVLGNTAWKIFWPYWLKTVFKITGKVCSDLKVETKLFF